MRRVSFPGFAEEEEEEEDENEDEDEDEDDKSKFAVAAEQEEAHLFREAIQRRFVDQESQLAEQQRRFADQESRLADQERRFADQESRLVHQAAQLKTMALTLKKTQATELERQARAGFGQAIPLAKAEASDDEIFVETTSTDANASDDGKDEGDGEDENGGVGPPSGIYYPKMLQQQPGGGHTCPCQPRLPAQVTVLSLALCRLHPPETYLEMGFMTGALSV